jgi:hypothetical protein
MSLILKVIRAAASVYAILACMAVARSAPLDPNAFTSLGTLNVSSGILTFNTSTLQVTGAASFTGVLHPQGPGLPDIAVFTFDDIDVTAGVTIASVTGSRPFALLSRSDLTILSPSFGSGGGQAGGSVGGALHMPGSGQGAGAAGGSGGGFGGAGGGPGGGLPYGDLSVALQAGSGGGGDGTAGGGGGGAIELGAAGTISISSVSANGAGGAVSPTFPLATDAGGGGSGGAILLHGSSITGTGTLFARGGVGGNGSGTRGGDGGGGGRITVIADVYTIGTPLPNANIAAGSGGASGGLGGSAGVPGNVGVPRLLAELTVVPAGQVSNIGGDGTVALQFGGTQSFSDRLRIDAGGLVFATAPVSSAHDLMLQGGLVAVSSGWTMTETSAISGFGQLSAPIVGGATNHVAATGGTLTLGDANRTAGVNFAGVADIEAGGTLNLLDADTAELGAVTTLAGGARLNSLNGVELSAGETVTASGAAQVGGRFTNHGAVHGPTAAGEFLTFTDDVDGPGGFAGNVLFSDGYSPGASPAHVVLQNVAFDATARLLIELGGITAGSQYDQLTVTGQAILAGTLAVSLIDGFVPAAGDTFKVFDLADYNNLTGAFASVELPTLPEPLAWDQSQLYTAGTLSVAPLVSFTADFDEDGDVDGADLSQWQGDFGANALSDADDDDDSDGHDFLAWQRQLGSSAPALTISAAVPEPAGTLLVLISAAFLATGSRRRVAE